MIKPKFKDPVDELVDSVEELGIKVQDFRAGASLEHLEHAAEVFGLNHARSRLRNAIRKILKLPQPGPKRKEMPK